MNSSRRRDMNSSLNTSHTNINSRAYLETSFWTEDVTESDDEGIGSDDSVTSDQRPPGAQCICDHGNVTKQQTSAVKTPLRVTKFLKVLKQSVRRDHHPNVGDKTSSPRSPRLLSNLVFGSDLGQHLSSSQKSVPNVVRRVGLSDYSDSELLLRILGHQEGPVTAWMIIRVLVNSPHTTQI